MHPAITTLVLTLGLAACWPASAQTDCAGTHAVLRLHVPAKALADLLNREVPERMEGRRKFDTSLLRHEYLAWSMNRSSIALFTGGDRLLAYTTIDGGVRVKGKVPFIGTDFSAGPDLDLDAALSLQPALDSDWRLHPNISADARVTKAIARILGSDVDVRDLAQEAVDGYLRQMEDQINGRFADSRILRREVERLWKGMHRVDRVSIDRLPDDLRAWLVVRPTRIGATHPRMTEAGIDFGVLVFAETDFVIGDEPRLTAQPLPPLEIAADLPGGRIELALPVYADWKAVNGLVAAGLEEPVLQEARFARVKVTEAALSSGPDGSVLVSAVATALPKGFIGWILYIVQRVLGFFGLDTGYFGNYGEHVVEMSVRPEVSEDGRRVMLKDARLLPGSDYLKETLAADYYGLTDETIRDFVEEHAVADLGAQLAQAEQVAQAEVDGLARKLGERGLSLDVEIRPVTRFASVSAFEAGLIARFCASADVDAEIRSLVP